MDRSPRGATGEPTGFDLALTGVDPTDADDLRPTGHGRWPAPTARIACRGAVRRTRPRPPASPAASAWTCTLRADQAAGPPRHATAGSTSGRPAARTTTRGRAMDATGTLHARRRDARASTGDAWFDHQWGDFISRRRRRLGLVRGQPRRRHGPDPLAGARRGRQLPARLRHARRARRHDPPPRPGRVHASRSPTAGRARRPAPTTRPAGRSTSRARTCRSTLAPTVADQELDTRATTGVVYWEGSQG